MNYTRMARKSYKNHKPRPRPHKRAAGSTRSHQVTGPEIAAEAVVLLVTVAWFVAGLLLFLAFLAAA